MLRNQVLEQMKTLKLHGMLAVYDEVLAAGLKARSTRAKGSVNSGEDCPGTTEG
jgi:hypothetical protein